MLKSDFEDLIKNLDTYTELKLKDKLSEEQAIQLIQALAKNTSVRSVDLSREPFQGGTAYSEVVCEHLANTLKQNKTVLELKLNGHSWRPGAMKVLAPALINIHSLEYAYNWIADGTNEGVQSLADILPQTQIRKLNLRHNHLSDSALAILAKGIAQSKIEDLDLSWQEESLHRTAKYDVSRKFLGYVSDPSRAQRVGVALSQIISQAPLLRLNLGHNYLDAVVVREFANSFRDNLFFLDLACNELGNEGFQALAEGMIKSKAKVAHLNLSGNHICDEVAASVKETKEAAEATVAIEAEDPKVLIKTTQQCLANFIKTCTSLRKLDLGLNGILEQGLQFVAPVLKDSQISWLSLAANIRASIAPGKGEVRWDMISSDGAGILSGNLPTTLTHLDAPLDYSQGGPGSHCSNIRRAIRRNQDKPKQSLEALQQELAKLKKAMTVGNDCKNIYQQAQSLLLHWEKDYPGLGDDRVDIPAAVETAKEAWTLLWFQKFAEFDSKEKTELSTMGEQARHLADLTDQLQHLATSQSFSMTIAENSTPGAITVSFTPAALAAATGSTTLPAAAASAVELAMKSASTV